jgi:Holliday junction resolvase RusA-like endonuclease
LSTAEIVFELPYKTLSINHLYLQRGYHRFITKEGRELEKNIQQSIKEQIGQYNINSLIDKPLEVEISIFEEWETKAGKPARKDISNREKHVVDVVFKSIGIDDKWIYKHVMTKKHSKDNNFTIITIREYIP